MAKFLAYYIVADSQYKHGKLRYITSNDDFTEVNNPANPEDPLPNDPGPPGIAGLIDADKDKDTLPFSFTDMVDIEGEPTEVIAVMVCNVFTPLPSPPDPDAPAEAGTGNPLKSTGRYTLIYPTLIDQTDKVDWRTLPDGPHPDETVGGMGKKIRLVLEDSEGNHTEVAGNPQSIIKIGSYHLLILGYDSTEVYRLNIADFKATPEGGDCVVTVAIDLMAGPARDITVGEYHHGTALLAMVNPKNLSLHVFGTYSNTAETSEGWVITQYQSTLVDCIVSDEDAAELDYLRSSLAGINVTDMDKYTWGEDEDEDEEDYLLLSAVGGTQGYDGLTNAGNSCVNMVKAFADNEAAFDNLTPIIQGDGGDTPRPVTKNGAYDTHFLVISADGKHAYLGTLSYDEQVRACWRYYKANLAGIAQRASNPYNDVTISTLVELGLLVPVDSGFEDEAGYYWEGAMINAAGQAWMIKGNSIRISLISDYSVLIKEINAGNGTLYDSAFNINSLGTIGDSLYPPEEAPPPGKAAIRSIRLGKHRMLALHARVARNAAKARAAEIARTKAAEEAARSARAKAAEHPTETPEDKK
jgi:hypothetical protein